MRFSGFLIACLLGGVVPVMPLEPNALFHHFAAVSETPNPDSVLFLQKQKIAVSENSTAVRTVAVARSFLGTPYVKGCLDQCSEECLTVNLQQLDCWTFVENSLAIAKAGEGNFDLYKAQLQQLRYWAGSINGYGSRIHYFTGWLLQAEKTGLLQDITKDLGGISYQKKIGYITARPAKFPKVKQASALRELKAAEKRITAHPWFYVPQNRIAKIEHLIQEGDIVSLTSAKADLDIAHQGFAVKIKGRIHLMHASSLSGKVIISRQPLAEYVVSQRGQTGIMVARLK